MIAQNPTGKASAIMQTPLLISTDENSFINPQWNIALKMEMTKGHGVPNEKTFLQQKQASAAGVHATSITKTKKTRANPLLMGNNFRGNQLISLTPTDNSMAISNGGKIVTADNYSIEYYNEDGTAIQQIITWNDFLLNDTSLLLFKYDPRVIYDNVHDRFIVIILHAPVNNTQNKIILAYSKTNNPANGWNIYSLNGNPYNDSSFADYPNMGITNNELFINVNLFKSAFPYNYNQSVIYQISLANGYGGANNLNYKIWGDNITTPTNLPGFTLVPVNNGLGQSNGPSMWFVSTWPDGGDSNVYTYQITKELFDTTAQLLQYKYSIPTFNVCANAKIKNPVTGVVDSLSTGSSVVQSAFVLDSTIHFTFDADFNSGWCGINYGRINLRNATAQVTQFGLNGTYLSYPAIASLGSNEKDKKVVLAYLQADTNILPQTCAVSADALMNFSLPTLVKTGDTIVDILTQANYPGYVERWGDYTGIQRRYASTTNVPEVWMAGAYASNNFRKNSYNSWIAQLFENAPSGINTPKPNSKFVLYPNPVIDIFNTSFYNNATGDVRIEMINSNGQNIKTLFNGMLQKGECTFQFNKGVLTNGIYFLQITHNNKQIYNKQFIIE
jgi:hypothetical protein